VRTSVERLRYVYEGVAKAWGGAPDEVAIFAECLLRADLRGHQTQGIGLLPYLDGLFDAGVMRFGQPFEVLRDAPATALVDGHSGVGQVVATRAMALAIDKAKRGGVGLVAVRRSSDCGMVANYAIQAQERGLIGMAMSTGPLLVAPWGGRDAMFCTNPLALAVPAGKRDPIVIDMATSAYSMGAVVLAARAGAKLETRGVVDRQGRYSDDPAPVILNPMHRESRMAGALLPAGPKGFGMLMFVDVLAALLSGERRWVEDVGTRGGERAAFYGQTFLAISVEHFMAADEFSAAADRMIETLRAARPAEGFENVRLHGEAALQTQRDFLANGVEVRDEEWRRAEELARKLGLSLERAAFR